MILKNMVPFGKIKHTNYFIFILEDAKRSFKKFFMKRKIYMYAVFRKSWY